MRRLFSVSHKSGGHLSRLVHSRFGMRRFGFAWLPRHGFSNGGTLLHRGARGSYPLPDGIRDGVGRVLGSLAARVRKGSPDRCDNPSQIAQIGTGGAETPRVITAAHREKRPHLQVPIAIHSIVRSTRRAASKRARLTAWSEGDSRQVRCTTSGVCRSGQGRSDFLSKIVAASAGARVQSPRAISASS